MLEYLFADYPPPLPKDTLSLPKIDVPLECLCLHLPLCISDSPPGIHCPLAVAAACIPASQSPSDIVYTLGILSLDMATIYMSPDPYDNAFKMHIDLCNANLDRHCTAGMKLFKPDG